MPRVSSRGAILLPFLLLAALLLACRDDGPDGPFAVDPESRGTERPFLMGLSSLPADPSEKAYRDAFRLAGQAGDVVLIQRAPPWSDFVTGATISNRVEQLTRYERDLAEKNRLKLFLAIDPTDPVDRGRLAALPDDMRGADFSDQRVRGAFVSYAAYLALNYKPAYLALGVEVDMFFARRGDAAFRNFQSLYFEAYNAVKDVSADTLVFPTFQYEAMQGILRTGEENRPAWSLVNRFEPKIDMLAISTYPGFVYGSVDKLPPDYYGVLRDHAERPLAFVSTGWTSSTLTAGFEGQGEQAAYLRRALDEAERLGAHLFVWYLGRDPTVAPTASFGALAAMGLLATDGQPKHAWYAWLEYAVRPPPS